MFEVKIRTGGAAFKDPNGDEENNFDDLYEALEIKRLLDRINIDIREGRKSGSLMDINGNKVGEWRLD